jgi:hypothetical protein
MLLNRLPMHASWRPNRLSARGQLAPCAIAKPTTCLKARVTSRKIEKREEAAQQQAAARPLLGMVPRTAELATLIWAATEAASFADDGVAYNASNGSEFISNAAGVG